MKKQDQAIPIEDRVHLRPLDVAQLNGISLHTVYTAISQGQLRASKLGAKTWIIKPADVEAWIEQTAVPNTPATGDM